ncbi:hypothetical protein A3F28_00355 [Candidatus Uhrbacteria bacterium RIFCSPHIGHO2_12_FULL_57_11]|uniref:Uncharacterized protein n=2 Tax=Candidatus Uhriibacteriota TaxID=1752732 RepID=A0A1F7UKT2_9BACT|nr:MAG: hypothetical protein A3D72_01935 [Candidatus Uhrbacteria bacterium RIFCSPHIGHO2_02_FULL_57_19]OGL78307.1 MAG: hypothetical protein A3F28_00355 [Candidatus Uhrbacteria bacterium RIFCSPHIGHO2_12_FULL_57_11]
MARIFHWIGDRLVGITVFFIGLGFLALVAFIVFGLTSIFSDLQLAAKFFNTSRYYPERILDPSLALRRHGEKTELPVIVADDVPDIFVIR